MPSIFTGSRETLCFSAELDEVIGASCNISLPPVKKILSSFQKFVYESLAGQLLALTHSYPIGLSRNWRHMLNANELYKERLDHFTR